jgi:phytoene/squalene synthetase
MKKTFDDVSMKCSKLVTKQYSTSFSLAVKMLDKSIRNAIYSIYGFVRFSDEIVDSFHNFDKEKLINDFEADYYHALETSISLNPILNSFQHTVKKYDIDNELVQAFMKSMKLDLKKSYYSDEEYKEYIYGSADVVGLMCLKVFVKGDQSKYDSLEESAMKLGSAFQKVNFLRDLKDDFEELNRSYFPNIDVKELNNESKKIIITEIEEDFKNAKVGIKNLPKEAKFGVYTAYVYYLSLLKKLKRTPAEDIMKTRIRISNPYKILLLIKSFVTYKTNLI